MGMTNLAHRTEDLVANGGVLWAWQLTGQPHQLDITGIRDGCWPEALVWVQLQLDSPVAAEWLTRHSGLSEAVCETLLHDDSRPEFMEFDDGIVLNLRGINMNPDQAPEEMLSLRMWLDERRILAVRRFPLAATEDLRTLVERGRAVPTACCFLAMLLHGLNRRISLVCEQIDDAVDQLEARLLQHDRELDRREIDRNRLMLITLKRFLGPQREALLGLAESPPRWFLDENAIRIRAESNALSRYVEHLEEMRARLAVLNEHIGMDLAERSSLTIYRLSVMTALFLPLGFVTSLLGANVGGIPGGDSPTAFWYVCAFLGGLALVEVGLFLVLRNAFQQRRAR